LDIEKKLKALNDINKSTLPDYSNCITVLDKALVVLWYSKEIGEPTLSSKEIVEIALKFFEDSNSMQSVSNALAKAKNKIHIYKNKDGNKFEIMQKGKDYLKNKYDFSKGIDVIMFEPGKRYTARNILLQNIFNELKGELKILDPYCDEKSLSIMLEIKNNIKFITRLSTDIDKKRKMESVLKDFISEKKNIQIADYQGRDIHDRYIISKDAIIILGHGIQGVGTSESFAIVLKGTYKQQIESALLINFSKRWDESNKL